MDVTLTAETGRPLGTSASRRLRREGRVPGVVYGLGKDAVTVSVGWAELRAALTTDAGLNALIDLSVDGEHDLAIVKELQRDAVRRSVVHVDFIRIDPDAVIEVEVPVVLVGEAEGLAEEGGLVDQLVHLLRILAKPGRIPNELQIEITDLGIDVALKVSDIALPEGVTTEVDPDEPVATGYIPRAEVVEEVEGEEGELVEGEVPVEGEEGEAPAEGGDAEVEGDEG
jgi:large subunit ribosomal protein L25